MSPIPMTATELAGWTAQQSARHETTLAPARAARTLDAGLARVLGAASGAAAAPAGGSGARSAPAQRGDI